MKRYTLLLCLLALPIFAQIRAFTSTLTAAGTTQSVWAESNYHTVQVVVSGSPSACTVRLEGSLDNNSWVDLSGTQSCTTSPTMFHVDGKPVTYVRVNLLSFTGASSATITYKGTN